MPELLDKIKDILTDPGFFFSHLHKEHGIKDAFIYLVILHAFSVCMSVLVSTLFDFSIASLLGMESYGLTGPETLITSYLIVIFALIGYVLSLGLSFVFAGINHVYLLIFSGKGSYEDTYKMGIYAGTPNFLLGWIPFVGYLSIIWSMVLLIIGTHYTHKISMKKAALIYIIPLVLFFILCLALVMIVFSLFMSRMAVFTPPVY